MPVDPNATLHLVYVSHLTPGLDYRAVSDILRTARRHNARDGVAGLLVFDGQHFCSALSGPPRVVGRLSATLALDRRHVDLKVLLQDQEPRVPTSAHWRSGYVESGSIARVRNAAPDDVWEAVAELARQADLDDDWTLLTSSSEIRR